MKKPTKAIKSTAIPTAAVIVASMFEIAKLSQADRYKRFAERSTASARAFIEMGKLHHAITGNLKKNQTIYGELRKLGVKDSTISNASYASRIWGELVEAGHLTEAQFDACTFQDCFAICRAMGSQSKRRLAPEEISVLVNEQPETFDDELRSIYETGLTVAEVEAQAKAQAKAESDRKAAEAQAEKEAKKRAETPAPVVAETPEPPAESESEGAPSAPVAETSTMPKTPVSEIPAPASIIPMPHSDASLESNPDRALPEVLAALDELLTASLGMSHEARRTIFGKINGCQGVLADSLNAEVAIAA